MSSENRPRSSQRGASGASRSASGSASGHGPKSSKPRSASGAASGRGPKSGKPRPKQDEKAKAAARARRKAKQEARKTGIPGEEVQQPHDPILRVRDFTSVDFSQLSYIMPPEWLFDGLTDEQKTAQANMDFAGVLRASNIRLVATIDDGTNYDPVLVGIAFASTTRLPEPKDAFVWKDVYEKASETLRYGAQPARIARTYELQLGERGQMLIDAAGEARGEDAELELFVVNPEYRSHGVGKALMAEFQKRLEGLGAQSYWLQTDSTCTWQWYENHGYTRVADVELSADYPMPPTGETTDEAPHVFMYKKDLVAEPAQE